MNKSVYWLLAFLSLQLFNYGCASRGTNSFELQLDGKSYARVFGHNRKLKISGVGLSGGKFSGPGITNGYFIPSEAGNGTHKITFSKFLHQTLTTQITVFGGPRQPKTCPTCNGSKSITCPACKGKGQNKQTPCKSCDGKGKKPCPWCVDVDLNPTTKGQLLKVLQVFSTSRLELGKKEHILKLSRIEFDEQETLNPTMSFYLIPDSHYFSIRPFDELKEADHEFNKKDSTKPVSFLFKKKISLLEENNICIIAIYLTYGKYRIGLWYDLRDILEDDGELMRTYVYPRCIFFEGNYYHLPYGLVALDPKTGSEKNSGKGWRDVEVYKDWHYQEYAKKGYVKIVNDANYIVFYSEEAAKREKNDLVWKFVKEWLDQKDGYWKTVADNPYESLQNAMNE